MILSLCACGKNDSAPSVEKSNSKDRVIEFTDVVLIDDDTVKIELVKFYAKDVNWTSGKQNEKYVTFKTTNKSNHEISINPGKFYLNNEEAYVSMVDGSMNPAPGKSGQYSFNVGYNETPEHKALESLDVLYNLEGSFDVMNIFEDSSNNNSYEPEFSFKNALNPDNKESSKKEPYIYNFDDTAATDMVEFKMTRKEFANKVAFGAENTYYRPTTETKGLTAGEDKTFFAFTFEIKNISS